MRNPFRLDTYVDPNDTVMKRTFQGMVGPPAWLAGSALLTHMETYGQAVLPSPTALKVATVVGGLAGAAYAKLELSQQHASEEPDHVWTEDDLPPDTDLPPETEEV